jgi:hypothetical protein
MRSLCALHLACTPPFGRERKRRVASGSLNNVIPASRERRWRSHRRPGPRQASGIRTERELDPHHAAIPHHCPTLPVLRASDASRLRGRDHLCIADACMDPACAAEAASARHRPVRGSARIHASGDGMTTLGEWRGARSARRAGAGAAGRERKWRAAQLSHRPHLTTLTHTRF